MNLPNLPTDNLYKFMAIAGLALIGYCGFFAYQQVWELELQILRTETEEKIIAEEWKILNKNLDRLIERGKTTESEWRDVIERALVVITKDIQTKGKKKENDLLNKQLTKHYAILWIGIIGGILLCSFGFFFWYNRIQKPNDLLMNILINKHQARNVIEKNEIEKQDHPEFNEGES